MSRPRSPDRSSTDSAEMDPDWESSHPPLRELASDRSRSPVDCESWIRSGSECPPATSDPSPTLPDGNAASEPEIRTLPRPTTTLCLTEASPGLPPRDVSSCPSHHLASHGILPPPPPPIPDSLPPAAAGTVNINIPEHLLDNPQFLALVTCSKPTQGSNASVGDQGNDFITVQPKRKAASPLILQPKKVVVRETIPLRNSFAALASASESMDTSSPLNPITSHSTTVQPPSSRPKPTPATEIFRNPHTGNIPPIFLPESINFHVKEDGILKACTMKPVTSLQGKQIKIQCSCSNDFRAVVQHLKSNGIEYFTYRLAEDKKPVIAIRGLPIDYPLPKLQYAVESKNITVHSLRQVQTNRPTPDMLRKREEEQALNPGSLPQPFPLRPVATFQLIVDNDDEAQRLLNNPYIGSIRAIITPYKPSPGPPQCTKCQRFGHTYKTCGLKQRCVRCGDFHAASTCPLDVSQPAICANCNGSHPANFRGCPAYKTYAEKLRERRLLSSTPVAPCITSHSAFPSLLSRQPNPAAEQTSSSSQPTQSHSYVPSCSLDGDIQKFFMDSLKRVFSKFLTPPPPGKTKLEVILEEIWQILLTYFNGP